MPVEPFEHIEIGRTGLTTTRLGLGRRVDRRALPPGRRRRRDRARRACLDLGVRSFDDAPLYGYGNAERRMGAALRGAAARRVRPLDEGRSAGPIRATDPGRMPTSTASRRRPRRRLLRRRRRPRPRLRLQRRRRPPVARGEPRAARARRGSTSLYIHDPDDHWEAAMRGAYPALERLRARGHGPGDRRGDEPVRDADPVRPRDRHRRRDARRPLHAARPGGAAGPAAGAALERGVAVMVGRRHEQRRPRGPRRRRATSTTGRRRPGRRAGAADRPRSASATGCRSARPRSSSRSPTPRSRRWSPGVRTAAHLDEYPAAMRRAIPAALWDELRAEGLIPARGPGPADDQRGRRRPPALLDPRPRAVPVDDRRARRDPAPVPARRAAAAARRRRRGRHGRRPGADRARRDARPPRARRGGAGRPRRRRLGRPDRSGPRRRPRGAASRGRVASASSASATRRTTSRIPEWLLRPDVRRGIAIVGRSGLAIDLLVRPREMPAALELVRRRARDPVRRGPPRASRRSPAATLEPWATLLAGLAGLPNTWCKLSGLVTEAAWDAWTVDGPPAVRRLGARAVRGRAACSTAPTGRCACWRRRTRRSSPPRGP